MKPKHKWYLKKIDGQWWILELGSEERIGPYDTRREALDDKRGLERFDKYGDRPGFVTCDRPRLTTAH